MGLNFKSQRTGPTPDGPGHASRSVCLPPHQTQTHFLSLSTATGLLNRALQTKTTAGYPTHSHQLRWPLTSYELCPAWGWPSHMRACPEVGSGRKTRPIMLNLAHRVTIIHVAEKKFKIVSGGGSKPAYLSCAAVWVVPINASDKRTGRVGSPGDKRNIVKAITYLDDTLL